MMTEKLEQFGWISRQNNFNEGEGDDETLKKFLEEDNLVVASWINDLGNGQSEFDVRQ